MKKLFTSFILLTFLVYQSWSQVPEFSSWIIADGTEATYYVEGNTTPQNLGGIVNVKFVKYDDDFVYINASGLPEYTVGPFPDGNPSLPGDNDYVFKIPRSPQENTGTKTETSLGQIGVWINGVPIYNPLDAMSYNDMGIWNRDAQLNEADGFDCNRGHPAPNMADLNTSYYHHHQIPITFSESSIPLSDICDMYPTEALFKLNASEHSPLIGYSFDGYPVYGPYGYSDPADASSSIRLIKSSYAARSYVNNKRTSLPDGTVLTPDQYGPDVNSEYPIGTYIEDYAYNAANGDLDEYNGRWCVTPEYPAGVYAYFATVNDDFNSTYPYSIGPSYYGVVEEDNYQSTSGSITGVTVPASVSVYAEYTGGSSSASSDIIDLSPNNVDEGTASVSVTFGFDTNVEPPTPPSSVAPNSVTLGGVSANSISRDATSGEVTATFDVATLTAGDYDIEVTFQPPTGDAIVYTGTELFTINAITTGGGSSEGIINVSPSSGNNNVILTFDFDGDIDPPTPPNNVAPNSVTLGDVAGTSISRDASSGEVTVTFDLTSLADGLYDLEVTFQPPTGDAIVYTGTEAFEVKTTSTGGGTTTYTDPELESWWYNKEGTTYTNNSNEVILIDVADVYYDDTYFYVASSGVPSHYMDGQTAKLAADQEWTHLFPRNPTEQSGTKTTASVKLGLFVDGTIALSPGDGKSYNNEGVWNQLAFEFEGNDFDDTEGHSTPTNIYHHHVAHKNLYEFTSAEHSPIVGYAFDGFPIYGPFGYSDANDENSSIERMTTSYQTRNITDRTTLADGTVLTGAQIGPAFSEQALGKYEEDYAFVANSGTLDYYNGRWCVTPEYPEGIYAYFLTVDESNTPQYPYILGLSFYGDVETTNVGPQGGTTAVPNVATEFILFISNPEDETASTGGSASFTAECTGTPDAIQWYVSENNGTTWSALSDDFNYSGTSTENLSITSIETTMLGNIYKAVITGTNATIESEEAVLIDGTITSFSVEIAESNTLKIYPNPAEDMLWFSKSLLDVKVFDMLGNIVFQGSVSEKLNISNWASGIYFVTTEEFSQKLYVK